MSRLFARKSLLIVLALCVSAGLFFSRTLFDAYEDIRFALDPTPARAYELGGQHFNVADPDAYDLERAEYFFTLAARDQSLPYVNHELARIAFLKGDLELALSRINLQISLHGSSTPNSYYVRALIEGYREEYGAATADYKRFLSFHSTNWAAVNDLAWVLLKAGKTQEALDEIEKVLPLWPLNPWLLNSKATALYELKRYEEAHVTVVEASHAVEKLTEAEWSYAYPGNDPLVAGHGVAAFKKAVEENMHTISVAREKAAKDVQ